MPPGLPTQLLLTAGEKRHGITVSESSKAICREGKLFGGLFYTLHMVYLLLTKGNINKFKKNHFQVGLITMYKYTQGAHGERFYFFRLCRFLVCLRAKVLL